VSRSRRRADGFADLVAALPQTEAVATDPVPADPSVVTDERGELWHLARGPLDIRAAKRLVHTADAVLEGHRPGWSLARIDAAERAGYWQRVKRLIGNRKAELVYEAYEYTAADGRTLLFLDAYCRVGASCVVRVRAVLVSIAS